MATNEAALNTIIQNSLMRDSWGFKIPDSQGGRGIQLPYDLLGVNNGLPLYAESKLIKNKYQSFNYASRVESHQWKNLLRIRESLKVPNFTLITLGVWIPRESFRVFFFDMFTLYNKMNAGIKSIKKKELEQLVSDNMYLNIVSEKDKIDSKKRKQFIQDIHLLKEKIIY